MPVLKTISDKFKINEKLQINLRHACLGKPRKINTFRKDFIWRD